MVGYGLSENCAGNLLGLSSPSRLIRSLRVKRRILFAQLAKKPEHERREKEQEYKEMTQTAKFKALMLISEAYDSGKLAQRVTTRLGSNVDKVLQSALCLTSNEQMKTLQEEIEVDSLN